METPMSKAQAAHEIVKSQGGYCSGMPWMPDYKPVPKSNKG